MHSTCHSFFLPSLLGYREWQRQAQYRTSLRLVLGRDPSLMSLDDRARNGKTHAYALILGREEGVEDMIELLLGNPRTGIRNRDYRRGSTILFSASDHRPAVGNIGHRIYAVHHQIDDDLLQLNRVSPDAQRFRRLSKIQRDVARRCLDRKKFERLAGKFVQIHLLRLKWRPFQEAAHSADHFVGAQMVPTDILQDFLALGEIRRRRA